ncbi:hypothetical protein B296_00017765, partial [Ensete ventricosum]
MWRELVEGLSGVCQQHIGSSSGVPCRLLGVRRKEIGSSLGVSRKDVGSSLKDKLMCQITKISIIIRSIVVTGPRVKRDV